MGTVKISNGNSKMGAIPSVSLPSVVTCRQCECNVKCYARKLERLRPNVAAAYRHNLEVLQTDPDTYWREVEASVMMSRFFRFHVSGDIPDSDYFVNMVEIARRQPHCEILCFTKRYEIVNDYVYSSHFDYILGTSIHPLSVDPLALALNTIPPNLHIIFSAWVGLDLVNPFSFPTAYVRHRDGVCLAPDSAINCSGNCTECAKTGEGCWTLQHGESVVFDEH